jgi:Bacterial regulatory proteins, luxR family
MPRIKLARNYAHQASAVRRWLCGHLGNRFLRKSCRSRRWPPRGCPTREIADRLFLSHRTVEAHLYRVFPKLGIVSRSELARVLDSKEPSLAT